MENNEKIAKLLLHTGEGKLAETEITQDQLGELLFGERDNWWSNIRMILPEPEWTRFYEDGILAYEGYSIDQKAFGAGRTYYRNGSVRTEGIYGLKGMLSGKEYYPNGMVRFEGCYRLNRAYGPNFPEYGSWFDERGELKYHGKFVFGRSTIGFPLVIEPKGFTWIKDPVPKDHVFMWEDAYRHMPKDIKKDRQPQNG